MPEKHSPEIYKASILEILGKTPTEDEDIIWIPQDKQDTQNPTSLQWEDTPEEWEEPSDSPTWIIEKEEKSKQKLRQHLLNKYSS